LLDSIVNFDEQLPARDLNLGWENAQHADLCLVLGSSLTVTPANGIPEIVGQKKGAKLAICNLQRTPIDELCDLRIFSEADTLMMKVMEKLDLPIPPFILRRRLVVNVETQEDDRHRVTVTGVDSDGTPVTFLQSVRLEGSRRVARTEPYVIHVRESLRPGAQLKLDLEFMGHYNEPNLEIVHDYNGNEDGLYILEYNPQNGAWVTRRQQNSTNTVEITEVDVALK
jgi:NAD-dependent protein deacetylases, SIR2 family